MRTSLLLEEMRWEHDHPKRAAPLTQANQKKSLEDNCKLAQHTSKIPQREAFPYKHYGPSCLLDWPTENLKGHWNTSSGLQGETKCFEAIALWCRANSTFSSASWQKTTPWVESALHKEVFPFTSLKETSRAKPLRDNQIYHWLQDTQVSEIPVSWLLFNPNTSVKMIKTKQNPLSY